ncbi:hypothetical protein ANOM_005507 [Aspergillus nomiae NRRL 13137]|uniref:Uncharacterized protein n=1 Tax=Aspergillus nomiae NRRL (strain ATCC 15546 / NRRL 13137 / CBS 260.88 / M93) TaxID=1509407 RepID=A0A0L1J3W3_ASPN3|nr:uncharacterized protein ANOM_005507 [Aspergillus nomiae NRRL 13137]KNG86424.1 hypothetical protein ANOM_005507 [Aspergillus nomiae NRRL 13137]
MIAIIILVLLGITGIVYLYSIRWRSQARAQLFIARAKSRKRLISESQSHPQGQATTPIQVTVVRGRSRAPSRRPSPRQSAPQLPAPPPRATSTTSRKGQRGRSRPNERQDNRQESGLGAPRDQSRMSKKSKKQKGQQQTGQTAGDGNATCSGGAGQPAQQGCSNQAADNEWGVGLAQQDDTQYTGRQDELSQPGPNNSEWEAGNEAVVGSSGGPTSPDAEWTNTGDSGGQQEASQGAWHANDAMEQRSGQQQTGMGGQGEPSW